MSEDAPPKAPALAGPKRDTRFKPGRSGNPAGRKAGSRATASLMAGQLIDGQAKALAQAAINLALAGDAAALKVCFDRLCPIRKGRPTPFTLPAITTLSDLPKASQSLLEAVADGSLTPTEAAELAKVL